MRWEQVFFVDIYSMYSVCIHDCLNFCITEFQHQCNLWLNVSTCTVVR